MLYVNTPIPAVETLREEGLDVTVGHNPEALHVGLLNLMPEKENTELDFCRMLIQSEADVCLSLLKIPGQTYKHTPQEYVEEHYVDLDPEACNPHLDGLIITGAPLEQLPFEEVRYWERLTRIFDWCPSHVKSTLCICWAAQAALYRYYALPKYLLSEKCFGVYRQEVLLSGHPLLANMGAQFPMPHSRHTAVAFDRLPGDCLVLAGGLDTSISILTDEKRRMVMIFGHLEYAPDTLDREYHRDLSRGMSIAPPAHYYNNDSPNEGIDYSWNVAARLFYRNWVATLVSAAE